MAVYDYSRPQMDGHLFGGRLNRMIGDTLGRLATWHDARATRTALNRLSDRELDDIGLCRADIARIGR
ncbi:DUF1127 domain-containing protein [Rhodovulum adriaticum]|uniref:Uncharacterized protein YjiS (DUF1127 family) n=1 Tax=Rhodovulum adriaticum TaxID=35804 RepID=A0A4R2NK75_RHOAD|nr:hypothetical protein [Rhodovulum adriaticum]TCP21782.1 uncharacterized protein YjiS (DUF1127 family) [Rhodovulum adriaticum]